MRAASDVFLFFFLCILTFCHCFFLAASTNHPDYSDALAKSILFFQGQRSGKLPHDQKITWRSDSGLEDGQLENVDLTGGYYDAGDNVKFNFPMAFTTTMLSWGALEYGRRLGGELSNVRAAVKWATDYLLKCANASPGKLYVGVGDPNADHKCWERPEDMDTVRTVYSVTAEKPGSDVAGETAAALAAASMVFRRTDRKYAAELVKAAKRVFAFAKDNRGAYSDSLNSAVCPFYCSYSGYQDELLWASAWLFRATKDVSYRNYILSSGGGDLSDIFSWDNKYAGAHVLLSRWTLVEKDGSFSPYKEQAEKFMCAILPKSRSPSSTTQYTQGGLIYKLPEDNLQYVTTTSFLLTTYAKYMKAGSKQSMAAATFNCGGDSASAVTPATLLTLAKQQVDYILGVNPLNMSYMVGFGELFPSKIHHRGSSLPSITKNAQHFSCGVGFDYLATANPNPNILVGAIVGGPNGNDGFANERTNYDQCEPATYINGAIVGPLALLASAFSKH